MPHFPALIINIITSIIFFCFFFSLHSAPFISNHNFITLILFPWRLYYIFWLVPFLFVTFLHPPPRAPYSYVGVSTTGRQLSSYLCTPSTPYALYVRLSCVLHAILYRARCTQTVALVLFFLCNFISNRVYHQYSKDLIK